jgi:formamidopyrimidine-DNA glycosylase
MTGHFFWKPATEPIEKHDLAIFDFAPVKKSARDNVDNRYHLRFNDYRRFGRLRLFFDKELSNQKGIYSLGPEPLTFGVEDFVALFKRCKRMIKPALLDQSFIAGIGNIYADEALWAAKINPTRDTSSISRAKLIALHGHIQRILNFSIKNMGTSIDTYSGVDGERGSFQKYLNAYGNEGLPCGHCGTKIVRKKIGARSAHYCPRCQRRP